MEIESLHYNYPFFIAFRKAIPGTIGSYHMDESMEEHLSILVWVP
jgi:hypothetical protein